MRKQQPDRDNPACLISMQDDENEMQRRVFVRRFSPDLGVFHENCPYANNEALVRACSAQSTDGSVAASARAVAPADAGLRPGRWRGARMAQAQPRPRQA